jgi:TIR domain-containing protein
MAYLPGFEHDIFISYVHDNNQDGWVTRLHNDLQKELDGSVKGVKIWRDRELNSNTRFDEKIRKTIEDSAIFLAITSKRYLLSDYCRQELEWFHGKAQNEPYGLSVNSQYRIFNALIHNIEYEKWPKEFSGITGLQLFDSFGKPLPDDEKTYKLQVRKLSVEIEQLILALEKEIGRVAKETPQHTDITSASSSLIVESSEEEEKAFVIFLAQSSTLLDEKRKQLINRLRPEAVELRQADQAIKILNPDNDLPPPYDADKHDERAIAEIGKAHLVINLLNHDRGVKMENRPGTTYLRRQVELGLKHSRRQLIWIPKTLEIEDPQQLDFIEFLKNYERPPTTQIIDDSFDEFCRTVKSTVEEQALLARAQAQDSAPPAVLISYDSRDRREGFKLGDQLERIGVEAIIESEVNDPELRFKLLKDYIKRVGYLILIYGGAEKSWLINKAFTLMQAATEYDRLPKTCGIYLAPPRNRADEMNQINLPFNTRVSLFDSADIADPMALKPLLGIG